MDSRFRGNDEIMARKPIRRVVVLSDLHVGSTVGLWPGAHRVEGGGEYTANVYQQWLMECWGEMLAEVRAMRPKPTVVVNGDAIQGVNYRDGQLITNKIDVQVRAAYALLEPLRKLAREFYMVRGTEWHEGKSAEHVEMLAQSLTAKIDPSSGQNTWWEIYLGLPSLAEMGGGEGDGEQEHKPVIHFAHHVGVSSVPWYEATVPLRDTLLLLAELARFYGDRAPDVRMVVRSHRHRFIYVLAPPDIHVAVTPAWQLKTAFAHKKASSMVPEIGYFVVEWDGRDLLVKPRIFQLPDQHVEVVG